MSSSNTRSLSIRLLMIVFTIVLFGADMTVSAQNANTSETPPDNTMQNDNATNTTPSRGRRRRGRRRRGGNMNTAATIDISTPPIPVPTGRCDPMQQEQTDLSGTYTGTVNYPEAGLTGDATLTITGNDFSMTSGSSTQEGRVVAVTTCNYTAVTMRFGKDGPAAPGTTPPPPLPTVSLRARRTGGGIMLASVPGETRQFSFSSGGGGRRGRRRAATMPTPTMTHVR